MKMDMGTYSDRVRSVTYKVALSVAVGGRKRVEEGRGVTPYTPNRSEVTLTTANMDNVYA
jgi:hypothetical protein